MMRQSPEPYIKGKARRAPPLPRCASLLPGMRRFVHHFVRGYRKLGVEASLFVWVKRLSMTRLSCWPVRPVSNRYLTCASTRQIRT